jgi:hypothetical protein
MLYVAGKLDDLPKMSYAEIVLWRSNIDDRLLLGFKA